MSKFFLISLFTTTLICSKGAEATNRMQMQLSIENYYQELGKRTRIKAIFYDNGEVETLASGRQRRRLSSAIASFGDNVLPEDVQQMRVLADQHFSFTNFYNNFGRGVIFIHDKAPYRYDAEQSSFDASPYDTTPLSHSSGKKVASSLSRWGGVNRDIIVRN